MNDQRNPNWTFAKDHPGGLGRPRRAADEAMAPAGGFLRSLLEHGPVASKQIRAEAEGAGYAWRTIQRAQKALAIEAYREGFGKEGVWYWRLADAEEPKDSHGGDLDNASGDDREDWLPNYEAFMKIGLKAQSQCRTTLETPARRSRTRPRCSRGRPTSRTDRSR